MHEFGIKLRLI